MTKNQAVANACYVGAEFANKRNSGKVFEYTQYSTGFEDVIRRGKAKNVVKHYDSSTDWYTWSWTDVETGERHSSSYVEMKEVVHN